MHRKFEINRTKIKGGCQSGTKVLTRDSKSDLPLSKISIDPKNGKKIKTSFILKNLRVLQVSNHHLIVMVFES